MLPSKDLPQLYGKLTVQGKDSQRLVSFIRSLGKSNILSVDTARVIICTEKCEISNCDDYAVAFPYYKGFDKTTINCKQILTYAIDDNGADVVAKNIRKRDSFVTFELLAPNGIGRVCVGDTDEDTPRYALALACGLILAGLSLTDTIAFISQNAKTI